MKRIRLISIITSALFAAVIFASCGVSGYLPSESDYFIFGDVYRVFTPSGEPEESKGFGLNSLMFPTKGISAVEIDVSESYAEKSLFFYDTESVNRDGIIAVYNHLGISDYSLCDEPKACGFTGLYTFNEKIKLNETRMTVSLDGKPDFTVYGDVSDVTIYTFDYEDRDCAKGCVSDVGNFTVILCKTPYLGTFTVYGG